jgi:hypothetical protein
MLAVKLKATNAISSQSSKKVNVIANRGLSIPTLNVLGNGYDWSSPVQTQSIAWAIADMCKAAYGAGVTEARFDVGQLIALDAIWTARGDKLNCIFDSSQTFWEALSMACRAGRCRPYVQGGIIHFVRDSLQTLPTALFTNRNIVKNTFKITYVMPSDDNADSIDVEYFDEVLWRPRVVRAQLDAGTVTKTAKIKAFGITNRTQAYKEGMYAAASNRYRRKEITFETELEGHIPALGDLIGIQNDIPEWGQSGEVVSYASGTLTSSEPFTWTDGAQHYMMLRRANGSALGPISVSKGVDDNTLMFLQADLDFALYSGFDKERTHISFGRSGQVIQLARVLTTTPRGNTVQITAINEDARVHAADGTSIPVDTYAWSLTTPKIRPMLSDFALTQTGSGTTPSVLVSWNPVAGASKYIVEKSDDNINWVTVSEVTGNSISFLATGSILYVRVAAFGGVLGAYVTKSMQVGLVPPPANVTVGTISANGQAYNISWTGVQDSDAYYVEVLNGGFVKRSFDTITTNFDYTVENALSDGGPWREVDVKIRAKKGIVQSVTPLTLNGVNAAPSAPTIQAIPGAGNISITVSPCTDSDYAGTVIYASDTASFTPSPANKIYEGYGSFYLLFASATKYIKAAHYDTYGKTGLNYSSEYSVTPLGSLGNKVAEARLYKWAATMPVGSYPNGASTFTWTTGEHNVYTGTNGWSTTAPSNPNTPSLSLWVASKQVVDLTISNETTLDWTSGYTITAVSTNGADGVGISAISVVSTNNAHTIPTDNAGNNGVYTGSGTTLRVFEGATELTYDGAGLTAGKWKVVATATGITAGAISLSGITAVVANHSAMTADTASVSYAITGKRADGSAISLATIQTLSKSKAGVIGNDAIYNYIDSTSPVISKDAQNAGTSGAHTNITVTGKRVVGATESTYGFLTVTGNGDVEAATATANTITTTIGNNDGKTSYTAKLYDQATVAGATLLDTQVIPVIFKGANGADSIVVGPAGAAGNSYRVAYAVSTLSSLNSTPATTTTTGSTSFPSANAFGGSETWTGAVSTLTAGQYQFKLDGVYSPSTGNTVWGIPYQAALKVGSLSAISANMGSITSGSVVLDNAGFIRGGQTAYATGTGFFLGYSDTTYKFSIGVGAAGVMSQGLSWDGTALDIKGNLTAGSISLGTGFGVSASGAITLKSATTGARLEIVNDVIRVYDAGGVLRVKLGNLA